jgi:predicted dehydrogenase
LLEHSIHDVDMLHLLVGHPGIEDVVSATFEFANGARGTLATIWHDNLARPSMRRVEVFCRKRYVHIEGDDWSGPVHWTDSDGSSHSLAGADLLAAVAPLRDSSENPDAAFLQSVIDGTPACPDFSVALAAHRVVDAAYRSADAGGDRQQVAGL